MEKLVGVVEEVKHKLKSEREKVLKLEERS